MDEKENILVVCSQNSARSQMAEAYIRRHLGGRFRVMSAGVRPSRVHALTIQVLEEDGFDVSAHTAKSIDEFLGKLPVRYLILVCGKADRECPGAFPGQPERMFWPFDDPAAAEGTPERRLQTFRRVRGQIAARVRAWALELESENNA